MILVFSETTYDHNLCKLNMRKIARKQRVANFTDLQFKILRISATQNFYRILLFSRSSIISKQYCTLVSYALVLVSKQDNKILLIILFIMLCNGILCLKLYLVVQHAIESANVLSLLFSPYGSADPKS